MVMYFFWLGCVSEDDRETSWRIKRQVMTLFFIPINLPKSCPSISSVLCQCRIPWYGKVLNTVGLFKHFFFWIKQLWYLPCAFSAVSFLAFHVYDKSNGIFYFWEGILTLWNHGLPLTLMQGMLVNAEISLFSKGSLWRKWSTSFSLQQPLWKETFLLTSASMSMP